MSDYCLAIGLAALVVSCGRTSLEPGGGAGAASGGVKDAAGAAFDGAKDLATSVVDAQGTIDAPDATPLGCRPDVQPHLEAPVTVSDVPPLCGGEIAVAGATPLEAFVPDAVEVDVGSQDCFGQIHFSLYTTSQSGFGYEQNLGFSIPYDGTGGTLVGIFQVPAIFESAIQTVFFPATVEITAADDPYGDAGQLTTNQRPQGEVHVNVDVDTGCGHITGWFVTTYCGWLICV